MIGMAERDYEDEEETKPDKLSAFKRLRVFVDGRDIEVPTDGEERRKILQRLLRQFRAGPGQEFVVVYDGVKICSEKKT